MHTTRRRDPRAAKRRDIARSVLPSTARGAARTTLTALRRADRRAVAMALTTRRGSRGANDDVVLPDYPLSRHREAILDRRCADKLAPLERWAAHEVDGLELDAARARLRKVLPTGFVGVHAVSHLELSVLRDRPARHALSGRPDPAYLEDVACSIGRWALEHGRHGELNHQVHLHLPTPVDPADGPGNGQRRRRLPVVGAISAGGRPLLGIHDLDVWSQAIGESACARSAGARRSDQNGGLRRLRGLSPVASWAKSLGWSDGSSGR
ncbi:hypothetical protein [Rhabdothermincola salaria]|uniref:hypothetical protein n=1 Tax=Rhabdothermincola salaria TaxID=2903142 RepID=UPI001E2834AA|nr:hypothetical protein [Rhabdothermincola salaria]MCD9623936.1 hypothetical protein [Rhabdothermincola salaria]